MPSIIKIKTGNSWTRDKQRNETLSAMDKYYRELSSTNEPNSNRFPSIKKKGDV